MRPLVRFLAGVLVACVPIGGCQLCLTPKDAAAQVFRPNPSPTAKFDRGVLGLPQPSPVPSCVANIAFTYADAAGCIYACAGGKTTLLASSLGGATCAQATTGATPTPTATATPTSTP